MSLDMQSNLLSAKRKCRWHESDLKNIVDPLANAKKADVSQCIRYCKDQRKQIRGFRSEDKAGRVIIPVLTWLFVPLPDIVWMLKQAAEDELKVSVFLFVP